MFDFSEISLNSNLTNDNNDYLLDFNNNSFSEIFLNKKDQDFTFILFPRNKLFEEEIHFKNFDLNYSNKDKENHELITFYNDNKEFENINKDTKCQFFDKNFKDETGISILEKYGFVKILKRLEK